MCECVYGHRKERQGRDRGWRRRADTAKMQTNELKNAGCIAVVGVGRAALPAIWHCRKLINAPVAGCREPKESDRERIREQERESINREKVRESGMIKEEETRAERERERERKRGQWCAAPPVCRSVNFLKLNHYLSLLNAFPGSPETHPWPVDPLSPDAPAPPQRPLMPLVARSRALLCHSSPVDPRAASNDRQLAAKKSV